jgi:hypothetical protein
MHSKVHMQSNGTQAPAERHELPRGILILGAAKSGTTALFYAIRKALVARSGLAVEGLFEPRHAGKIRDYLSSTTDRVHLVKGLLGPLLRTGGRSLESFSEEFDKKVIIYRDPRDNVVSRICFMMKNRVGGDQAKISQILEMFREKESSPDSVSIVSMVRRMARIAEQPEADLLASVRDNALLPAKMKREQGAAYYFMPYDELVLGKFENLNHYLGLTVTADFEVDQKHSYVVRSKSSGAWKNWFIDEDVEFFVRKAADDFRLLGFDPQEAPNSARNIDARTSSEYVAAQFAHTQEKRKQARVRKREMKLAAATAGLGVTKPRDAAVRKSAADVELLAAGADSTTIARTRKLAREQRRQRRERRRARQSARA